MTPKEEAKKLINEFKQELINTTPGESEYWNFKTKCAAKKCALICIDKIEQYRKQIENEYDEDLYHAYGQEEYWQEVKQEINKL